MKALRTCAVYNGLLALYLKPAVPKLNPKSNALDGLALDFPWTCSEPESVNDDAWTSA